MGKFRIYADRVNEIAKTAFSAYQAAETALKQAETKVKKYPQRSSGSVTPEYAAQSARAQADLLEAREKLHTAQLNMNARISDISAIRRELATALQGEFCADPSEVDSATLELLKTGILRADEYATLLSKSAGNDTMQRLIAHYAGLAAEEAAKKYGERDRRVTELRAVSILDSDGASGKLDQFDVLAYAFQCTANNPAMIGNWGELTADVIEAF